MANKYLQISKTTKLSDLAQLIGVRNVETVLAVNGLSRTPNIGQQLYALQQSKANDKAVDWQRKTTLLNGLTASSDVFETAALLSEYGWKVLSATGSFPGMLAIPETIDIITTSNVLGNQIQIGSEIYKGAMKCIEEPPHAVDSSIFNVYSTIKSSQVMDGTYLEDSGLTNSRRYNTANARNTQIFQEFRIPYTDVALYSSLTQEYINLPVYPEEISDGVKANYNQMSEILYQYEPWQVYTSSGPRSNTYKFKFHRDMWGDHGDGIANSIIRFCEANCYPKYSGSAVHASTVTLYVNGKVLINGIMDSVDVTWSGPLGKRDNWYLFCELDLHITEVSQIPLSFDTVRGKGLIE